MKLLNTLAVGFSLVAAPLLAEGHASGDADAGAKVFAKCKACHSIVADDDTVIERGGKIGPNLYGVYTRQAGSVEDFRYGDSIVEAGAAGLMWNEADFVSYLADPKKFLAEYLDDSKARSKMAFRLNDDEDAANVWAYLVSVGPEVAEKAETEATN
ncbi:c-type cytochrome [Pseudosulfitobacter koreensis]|uniref:C-type cytochrome n=1 Tax=Pseudosulfitobacter koreensis TaxID=2968472 RepID=A0ABT1YWJ3_9RHOB|nr:c-type cytochrome [Pseudosulfitobacter koreense]MCR8825237.1 c-type cytochrome [Pseudosulfitobacter koreense]